MSGCSSIEYTPTYTTLSSTTIILITLMISYTYNILMTTPKHSDTYLMRLNNPKGNFKSEQQHINHFKARMLERFGLEVSTEEYYELVKRAAVSRKVYSLASSNIIKEIEFKGKLMWVIYAPKIDWQDQIVPARLKTVFPRFEKYSVPNNLADKFDTDTFTAAVKHIQYKVVVLAKELDLENRKEFFMREDIPMSLKHAALVFKRDANYERDNTHIIGLIVRYLTELEGVPVLD